MDDFTVLTAHQVAALKAWWLGLPYNGENLGEALIKLGITPAGVNLF